MNRWNHIKMNIICCICKEKFEDKYYKVRDLYHFTGEYRGAGNSIWNLKYSVPKDISIVFNMDLTIL